MEPEPAQAEFVYDVLYRLALFLSEITVNLRTDASTSIIMKILAFRESCKKGNTLLNMGSGYR